MKKNLLTGLSYLLAGGLILAFVGIASAAFIGTAVVIWGGLTQLTGGIVIPVTGLGMILSYISFVFLMAGSIVSFSLLIARLMKQNNTVFLSY